MRLMKWIDFALFPYFLVLGGNFQGGRLLDRECLLERGV